MVLAIYPTMSVFLVAITASLAFTARHPAVSSPTTSSSAAMVSVLAGDVVYMFVETHARRRPREPHRRARTPSATSSSSRPCSTRRCARSPSRCPTAEATPTIGRLVVVAVALAIPGLITVTRVDAPVGDRIALTVIVLSLTAAAITRLFRAVRAHARSEARLVHQATHDMLTGLPNRAYVQEYVGPGAHATPPDASAWRSCSSTSTGSSS